ncbi:unnamed protein product [Rotaria sp. Silwood2]|nr:unnamed protein product [Rotaria sp. Silwood2]CAF3499836.1 unnamed protein product [Rotaria sp. Silwood2]CAF4714192.1 unnamed protein product [Rotaria sp. Silwood2]
MSNNQQQHAEAFIMVCLDITFNTNNNQEKVIEQLRQIDAKSQMFSVPDQCIDYIFSLENELVLFLFVTDTIDHPVLTILSNLSIVSSIYILCISNEKTDENQLQSFQKVQRISTEISQLIDQIKFDIRRIEYEYMKFEILQKSNASSKFSISPNKQEYSFMFTKLLKDIFLKFEDDSTPELIEYYQSRYHDNSSMLGVIDEFKRTYQANKAINWYTRDSFIYRTVNEALRTQNAEALYKMRTFIRHLHQQLVSIQAESQISMLTLYRGLKMKINEFEKIRNNEGGLLSISSFLSTTASKDLAVVYAGHTDSREIAVVFELKIDSNEITNSTFACIEQFSHFGQSENEWLFSVGSVFRIREIQQIESIMLISLVLTDDQDENLQKLTEHMHKIIQIEYRNPLVALCRLFARMGKYETASELCKKNGELENGWEMLATLFDTYGLMHANQRNDKNALHYHRKALNTMTQHVAKNDPILASYYKTVAISYSAVNQDKLALDHYQIAIDLELQALQPDYTSIAYSYDAMGNILHYTFQQYNRALQYYKHALKLMLENLPPNHDDIISLYQEMADIYDEQGKYDEALDAFHESLLRRKASQKCKSLDLNNTLKKIATIYKNKGNMERTSVILSICGDIESSCPRSLESRMDNVDLDALIAKIFQSDQT